MIPELVRPGDAWLAQHMADFDGRWTHGKPARRRIGVMLHHTGSNRRSDSRSNAYNYVDTHHIKPPYNVLVGRGDSLAYALTERDIKANHAGRGSARTKAALKAGRQVTQATVRGAAFCNSSTWGVAVDNDGLHEPVSPDDYWTTVCVVAAICLMDGLDPRTQVLAHSEWTIRKTDPTEISIVEFRRDVHEALLTGSISVGWDRHLNASRPTRRMLRAPHQQPFLRRGSRSQAVRLLQQMLGMRQVDGIFGRRTQRAVRAFQVQAGLKPDGIVGPNTWGALNAANVI